MTAVSPHRLARTFGRLTLLNILASISIPLASLVDTAMLGHLDEIRFLAGVALAAILFDYVYWTFGFLRMTTTGLTAQAVGRDDPKESSHVLYRACLVGLALGLGLVVVQSPLRELAFSILGGASEVEAAGRDYFRVRIWDAPVTLLNMAVVGWFLGRARSGPVLVMTLIANLSNVALNYVFIVELGWAAKGAALGTVISRHLMLLTGLLLMRATGGPESFDRDAVLDPTRLRSLLTLSGDIFVRTLCLVTAFAVMTDFSARLGTAVLAANSILLRLLTLASYWIDGAAFATESLAGMLHGAGRQEMLRRLLRLALATGLIFATGFSLALFALGDHILRLFTVHASALQEAQRAVVWLIPIFLAGAFAYVLDGFFIGLTRGRLLRNSMLVSTAVVFLPIALWALRQGSNRGLWIAMLGFTLARALTLGAAALRT